MWAPSNSFWEGSSPFSVEAHRQAWTPMPRCGRRRSGEEVMSSGTAVVRWRAGDEPGLTVGVVEEGMAVQ